MSVCIVVFVYMGIWLIFVVDECECEEVCDGGGVGGAWKILEESWEVQFYGSLEAWVLIKGPMLKVLAEPPRRGSLGALGTVSCL